MLTMDQDEGRGMIDLLWTFHEMDTIKYPLEQAYEWWDTIPSFRDEIRNQYKEMMELVKLSQRLSFDLWERIKGH